MKYAVITCIVTGLAATVSAAAVEDFSGVHSLERRDFNPLGLLSNIRLPFGQQSKQTTKATAATTAKATPSATVKTATSATKKKVTLNIDPKKIVELFFSALDKVNVPELLRTYFIPLSINVLKGVQNFNGENVLEFIKSIKGKNIIAMVKAVDPKPFWQVFNALDLAPLVKTAAGKEVANILAQVQKMNGADLIEVVSALKGEQVSEAFVGLLTALDIKPLLDGIGIDITPVTDFLSTIDGASLLKLVESIDGEGFLKGVEALDGDVLVSFINKLVNTFLTQVRSIASQVVGGNTTAEFKSFDIINVVDTVQALVEKLTGLKFPSVSAGIKSFKGSEYIEEVRKLDFPVLIDLAIAAQQAAMAAGKVSANYASKAVANSTTAADAAQDLLNNVLKDIGELTGDKIISYITTFDPKPLVTFVNNSGILPVVKLITTADLTPFVDVLANFNGRTLVQNIQSLTSEDIAAFVQKIGLSEYLLGFTGLPSEKLVKALESLSGTDILTVIKSFDGKDVIDLIEAINGSKALATK